MLACNDLYTENVADLKNSHYETYIMKCDLHRIKKEFKTVVKSLKFEDIPTTEALLIIRYIDSAINCLSNLIYSIDWLEYHYEDAELDSKLRDLYYKNEATMIKYYITGKSLIQDYKLSAAKKKNFWRRFVNKLWQGI